MIIGLFWSQNNPWVNFTLWLDIKAVKLKQCVKTLMMRAIITHLNQHISDGFIKLWNMQRFASSEPWKHLFY